jgi:histone-lysine N-methyltransferase SETMAR
MTMLCHTRAIKREYLKQEKVVEFPHTPFLPDFAPCDFFLFPRLKKHLAGRKYRKDYENAFKNKI